MRRFLPSMMGHAIGFSGASVAGQCQDRRLSKEVHGRGVLIEVGEDRNESLARMQFP
jgi:hypothetical protein